MIALGEDRVADPLHGVQARVETTGRANAAGRIGPRGDRGDPLGRHAERERGLGRFDAEQVGCRGHALRSQGPYPVCQSGAVGHGLGTELAQELERALRGGPDHSGAA